MFIVYSYMFRLTGVIFKPELYLFAMSLCSFWDPRMSTVTLQTNIVLAWGWLLWVETCSYKL